MMGRYRFLGEQGYGVYEVSLDEGFSAERVDKSSDRLLVPGFVDLHFHGAYGLDFMTSTTHDLLFLAGKLEREGYEAVLPTTVAASLDEVLMAIGQLPEHPMFPGFHLEGPFISREYPGAQPQSAIADAPVGPSFWDEVFDHPLLRVITLAAEYPHALPLATRLMERGVIVSQGHTAATFTEARGGFQCGAFHVTHLFNAMRPFHHREPGIVGYALLTEGMSVEIIYDRQHVSADAMRLVIHCKNPDDIIAVSDSSAATRLPDGSRVRMWGQDAVVEGKAVRLADGTLAGSTITLRDAFKNLAQDFGEELAIRACCLNPRRALKMGPPKKYLEFDEGFNLVQIHQLT